MSATQPGSGAQPMHLRPRSEQIVGREILSQLEPGEAFLPGVRLTDPRHGDVEADIIVFIPGLGVAVVEVKGGTVVYEDGEWTTRRRRRRRKVEPIQQARRAKHALRRYLDRQPDWHHGLIRSAWFVAVPDTVVTGDLGPEGRRAQIIDRLDLPRAMDRIRAELANPLNVDPFPDSETIDTAISLVLRDNSEVTAQRRLRLPRVAKVLLAMGVLLVGAAAGGHWISTVHGWRWGLAVAGAAVPIGAVAMWWASRPTRRPRVMAALGGFTAAAALGVGLAAQTVPSPDSPPPDSPPAIAESTCAPGYTPCLPVVDDLDCGQIGRLVTVTGDDVYGLDRNGDGTGCESFQSTP